MKIIELISELRRWRRDRLAGNQSVVFVPTMGALHAGHASLISKARSLGDRVVFSIFVNRLQFNDIEDYNSYPDTRAADLDLCRRLGVDLVFVPTHEEMYQDKPLTSVSVSQLSESLCGAARPGHFDGVGIIVAKLFNIISPNIAVFGEKDLQQLQIIRRIVRDLSFDILIESAPIFREPDGLAMSSRNLLLTATLRQHAPRIFESLSAITRDINSGALSGAICRTIKHRFCASMDSIPGTKVDYTELVNGNTLEAVKNDDDIEREVVHYIATAVFFGTVRLIDNIRIEFTGTS